MTEEAHNSILSLTLIIISQAPAPAALRKLMKI